MDLIKSCCGTCICVSVLSSGFLCLSGVLALSGVFLGRVRGGLCRFIFFRLCGFLFGVCRRLLPGVSGTAAASRKK